MKFYLDDPVRAPELGDIRLRSGFLWFPKTCWTPRKRVLVTRWLERARWAEVAVWGLEGYTIRWEPTTWTDLVV